MELQQLKSTFTEYFGGDISSAKYYFSPGRINLIGEHIDYNGGVVFPAALTIGITAIVRSRADSLIRMRSLNVSGEVVLDCTKPFTNIACDGWGNYPKGVAHLLRAQGIALKGCDVLFSSTIPDGAGLSSSAAIETLMYYIICDLAGQSIDRIKMATDCQYVENDFIGVNCGVMDQFAVAMGKKHQAILLDCATLEYQYAPLNLGDYTLVIMNTNKRRELSDSKYNERRAECDAALALLQAEDGSIENLCQASPQAVLHAVNDCILRKRALHAVCENIRVCEAFDALKKGDTKRFGDLLNASHQSLKDYYDVTGFELDSIVEAALSDDYCIGARMTGAGFGGCAIALVESAYVQQFIARTGRIYNECTTLHADFYVSDIGEGTHEFIEGVK